MKSNYKTCLATILKYEGGYVNNPRDPGGATMKGITQKVYDTWRKKQVLPTQIVKNISQEDVEAIYKQNYWDVVKGDDLPSGLDLAVFDYAVNSGPGRAIKQLQKILGVPQTGAMNSATVDSSKKNPNAWAALCAERLAFMKRLDTWPTFGKGWEARVNDVRKKAAALVSPWPEPPTNQPAIDVIGAQKRLAELNYPLGSADGKIGPLTRSAIRDFQDAMGEPVTGNLDGRTYTLLMSSGALKRPVSFDRQALTKNDLKEAGSTIITAADGIKTNVATATGALAGAAGVAGQVNDISGQIATIKDTVKSGQESVPWLMAHWQVIFILILSVMVAVCIWRIWKLTSVVEDERIRQARSGENVRV